MNISDRLFLGVDLGTSALKCGLFDLAGQRIGSARVAYPTKTWADASEQHASDWWQALIEATRLSTKNTSPEHIVAVCIGGHAPSPVLVDAALEPICPVLPWCDHRSKQHHQQLLLTLGRDPKNGPERLMAQIAARAMWVRSTHPDQFSQTQCILPSSDYLIARLTGRRVYTGQLAPELFTAGDLPLSLLPTAAVEAGELIGEVTPNAANESGLSVGTPVVTGGLDSFLASFGSGICEPGDACINTGSATIVSLVTSHNPQERFRLGQYSLMSQPVRIGGRTLACAHKHADQKTSLLDFLEQATHLPAPVLNPDNLADFMPAMDIEKLSQRLANVDSFRFLLDLMLLKQRQVLDELQHNRMSVSRLRSAGGLATSPEFVQLQANVIGKTIETPRIVDSGTLGAAMLAAMALDFYHDHKEAVTGMSGLSQVYQPQDNIAANYNALSQII